MSYICALQEKYSFLPLSDNWVEEDWLLSQSQNLKGSIFSMMSEPNTSKFTEALAEENCSGLVGIFFHPHSLRRFLSSTPEEKIEGRPASLLLFPLVGTARDQVSVRNVSLTKAKEAPRIHIIEWDSHLAKVLNPQDFVSDIEP